MAGFVISLMTGEFANGIRLIERSLALNPNSAIGHCWCSQRAAARQ
jgi:hypothetical protein